MTTTTYRIAEVAQRSGFSRPTLRYYEEIGLLPAPDRTESGYRMYDERTLDRLSFIARAKELGCSLEKITDLSALWAGDRCGPVRERLHALVTDKLADAQRRVAELMSLTTDLQVAAGRLRDATPTDERPCGEDCACSRGPVTDPVACSLDASLMDDRLGDWQNVLGRVQSRESLPDGVRLALEDAADLGDLAQLVAAEQACCPFFSFAITVDARGVGLEVRSTSPEAREMVDAFFRAAT
jgi:DNA-binding transcriptional MerR regulator